MVLEHIFADEHQIEKDLCAIFPSEWLKQKATETKLIKRERKIDPIILFWVLAIGYGVQLQRTLAALKRNYEVSSKKCLRDSSWYDRFTPELTAFLKECAIHGIEYLAQEPSRKLGDRLSPFKDVLIQDNTIIRLHEKLAKIWPAARSRRVAAGIKVAVLTSAIANGPKSISIYSEVTNDLKTLRIGPWVKDRILLIDLGFYKYQLFTRISEYGGHIISRLKSNANPRIVGVNMSWRGRAIPIIGENLQDVLPELKQEILDVNIEVTFSRRKYRGEQRRDKEIFRLVAIYNPEKERYHLYITDIPLDVLSSEEIAKLYRARWEVEILFKELKSRYALDVIPTANPHIIEAFIWVSILTLLISRRVYRTLRKAKPNEKFAPFSHLRWSNSFAEHSGELQKAVIQYLGFNWNLETVFGVYASEALGHHVGEDNFTCEWWA
jgi:putative transposase